MNLQVRLIVADSLESANLSDQEKTVSASTHHFINEQLGVEDARMIINRLGSKSLNENEQTILVHFKRATVESQNALLKCFEEPLDNNILILVVPHESVLLPTLRSRFTGIETVSSLYDHKIAKEFIAMSYKDRLETIADKVKQKDKVWMDELLVSLGVYLSEDNVNKKDRYNIEKSLDMAARHIKLSGSSAKMLLENIALAL